MTVFDIIKTLYTKEVYLTDEELNQFYSQWMINLILASSDKTCAIANELNKPMSNRKHYDCLYYGIPKISKAPYTKYLYKKQPKEIDIEYIMEYYKVNKDVAKQYVHLISKEDMSTINEFNEKRGILKKKEQ